MNKEKAPSAAGPCFAAGWQVAGFADDRAGSLYGSEAPLLNGFFYARICHIACV